MASNQENHKSKLAQLYNCYTSEFSMRDVINRVLQEKSDINYKNSSNSLIRLKEPDLVGGTALHLAVLQKDIETFDKLLINGADIRTQNQQGRTPLHCIFNQDASVEKNEMLNIAFATHMSLGDSSNPCDVDGISHLHIACNTNNFDMVEFLLNSSASLNGAVNLNSKKFAGYTPLHFAAERRAYDVIKLLLKHEASMDIKDARGLTPFHVLLDQKIKWMDKFRECDKDPPKNLISIFDDTLNSLLQVDEVDHLGLTHFHIACAMQDTSVAEFYLQEPKLKIDQQVKMDSAFRPGYTALHFAAHCNLNMARQLLKKKANFEVRDANGTTPMDMFWRLKKREDFLAILRPSWKYAMFENGTVLLDFFISIWENENVCDYLQTIDLSTKIKIQPSYWIGCTPLHFIVMICKSIDTFQICIERFEELRMQVHVQDDNGSTPIHLAFRASKYDFIHLMAEDNFTRIINFADKDGLSYLHIFCAMKMFEHVALFSDGEHARNIHLACRGTYCHPYVKPGSTALHVAIASGDSRCIKVLLDRNLNPLAKDAKGETPLDRFIQLEHNTQAVCSVLLHSHNVTDEMLDTIGLTRFHLAIYGNVPHMLIYKNSESVKAGINCVNPSSFLYEYAGCTPLHMLIKQYTAVDFPTNLLEQDSDLLVKNARGECPLYTVLSKYVRAGQKTAPDILDWITEKLLYNSALRRQLEEMSGMTILHLFCYAVDIKSISLLMIGNVDVEARIKSDCPIWPGCTPLHILMKAMKFHGASQDINKAAILLLEKGADVSVLNEDGETPIHLTLKSFSEEQMFGLVKLLLVNLRVFNINPYGANGISHFHAACLINYVPVVKKFLDEGVNANEPIDFFAEYFAGQTPLHLAMEGKSNVNFSFENEEQVVDLLLMYKADVIAEDSYGYTPFHKAVQMKRNMVYWEKFVGNAPSVINTRNIWEHTPFELLLRTHIITFEEFNFFASRGCSLNDINPFSEERYLSLIMSNKYHPQEPKSVVEIHRQCFDIMMKTINQSSPELIHSIVTTNDPNPKIFNINNLNRYLQSIRYDVDIQDKTGKTGLHLAAKFGNESAVKELLKSGVDVNILDAANKTALEYAIEYHKNNQYCPEKECHQNVIKCLVSHIRIVQLLKMTVNSNNTRAKGKALNAMTNSESTILIYVNNNDLNKLRNVLWTKTINHTGLQIGDFLSELGKGVIGYPFMSDMLREKIDKFFRTYDHELKDVCMLQYRKALKRAKMMNTVIDIIHAIAKTNVPIVCIEMILQYLANNDLEHFVKGSDSIVRKMSVDELL